MRAWKLTNPNNSGLSFLFLTIRIYCFSQQKIKGLVIGTDSMLPDRARIHIKTTPVGRVTDLPAIHSFIKTYPGV